MDKLEPQNWIEKYCDYFVSLTVLKVSHKETAEDIVQDTFVSALSNCKSFRGDSSEKTWLLKILNNKIIDFYRKKDVLGNSSAYLLETSDLFYAKFFQEDTYSDAHWKQGSIPSDWTPEQEAKVVSEEFFAVFETCLKKMPGKLKLVFIAKFMDDLDANEICKENEISSSNYWTMIHRAKLILRECLEKNWFNI